MRCSAYSSATNRCVYECGSLFDSEIFFFERPLIVPDGDPAYLRSAMAHFYEKLVLIEESLKTDLGKQLGGKRHKFVRLFASRAPN